MNVGLFDVSTVFALTLGFGLVVVVVFGFVAVVVVVVFGFVVVVVVVAGFGFGFVEVVVGVGVGFGFAAVVVGVVFGLVETVFAFTSSYFLTGCLTGLLSTSLKRFSFVTVFSFPSDSISFFVLVTILCWSVTLPFSSGLFVGFNLTINSDIIVFNLFSFVLVSVFFVFFNSL